MSCLADSLAVLLRARARKLELLVDGERWPSGRYHLVVLANTGAFGGGMRVAPSADPEDGLLDLVTVADLPRRQLLLRLPLLYTGGHLGTAGVRHLRVRRVQAQASEPTPLNIDGEALGALPAVFEVLPKAVPFLCPS